MNEMAGLSAAAIARMVRSKEVSSREVTEHFIGRIDEVNPAINAVVIDFFARARAAADRADAAVSAGEKLGRIHGVPFTIKECFDYLDSPSTLGVLARRNDRPPADDKYIAALMREGGIVLGKTNVPQLLIFIESVNRVYGRTNNPRNHKFTCGGSSGGEGAIVAAGGSPVGIGSDIGGSVRFPAAFCGVCSIKPTMRRTPDLTRYGESALTGPIGSVAGVIANHAEDLELFLSIIDEAAQSERPLGRFSEVDPAGLRVGFYESDGILDAMPAVRRGVREAAEKLRPQVREVVEFKPPSFHVAEEIFYRLMTFDKGRLFTEVLGDEKPLLQLRNLFMILQRGPKFHAFAKSLAAAFGQPALARAIGYFGGEGEAFLREWAEKQEDYRQQFLAAMDAQGVDAVLGPVCAVPAFLHDTTDRIGLGGTYTLLYNVLGFPAGVARISEVRGDEAVPRSAGLDLTKRAAAASEKLSAGLPLAVQIAARPWREDIVLALIEKLHVRQT